MLIIVNYVMKLISLFILVIDSLQPLLALD